MKNVVLALLMSCFVSTAYAQDQALLFEVAGNGLAQPSYLYGTFHALCPADLRISDSIRTSFDQSEQVYLEIDFDDPALQANMLVAMMFTDGRTLKDFLSADDYATLDAYIRGGLGQGLDQMALLKPVALLSAVYVSVLKCQPASYDLTFARLAAQQNKEVLGLETLEQQIAVFDQIPMEEQLKGLLEMARQPAEAEAELHALLEAYKAQDLNELMKLIEESEFDSNMESFREELLDKRNSNWIPVIEKAAADKSTFFAFGAGHLGGPAGVVSLLREKGYTVRPIR